MLNSFIQTIRFLFRGPKIKILKGSPFYVAYNDSNGMDVFAAEGIVINPWGKGLPELDPTPLTLSEKAKEPNDVFHYKGFVKTGIRMELPKLPFNLSLEAQVWPRSGKSKNSGIETGAGLIDVNYRGEVGVVLYNNGNIPVIFPKGSRVAQLTFPVVVQLNKKSIVEVDHIEESARGVAGFGSTGV